MTLQLVKDNVASDKPKLQGVTESKPQLQRGQPYMAFVKVTPYYELNNPIPVMCRFNEVIPRKAKEAKEEDKALHSILRQGEGL